MTILSRLLGKKSKPKPFLAWLLAESLKDHRARVLKAAIADHRLIIEADINVRPINTFFGALGRLHGVITELEPDIEAVTIKVRSGPKITWKMADALAYHRKEISEVEFLGRWEVTR